MGFSQKNAYFTNIQAYFLNDFHSNYMHAAYETKIGIDIYQLKYNIFISGIKLTKILAFKMSTYCVIKCKQDMYMRMRLSYKPRWPLNCVQIVFWLEKRFNRNALVQIVNIRWKMAAVKVGNASIFRKLRANIIGMIHLPASPGTDYVCSRLRDLTSFKYILWQFVDSTLHLWFENVC